MINLPEGTKIGKTSHVRHNSLLWMSVQLWIAYSSDSGARAAETGTDDIELTNADYSFANLSYRIADQDHECLPPNQTWTPLDGAIMKVTCSKADPAGDVFVPFPVHLLYRSMQRNTCRLAAAVEAAYPPSQERASTPLFRGDDGKPLTIKRLRTIFKWMIKATVKKADRSMYSVHSFRIYLATCLKACGADDLLIQYMVRWQTRESLRLYCRMLPTVQAKWLDKVQATTAYLPEHHDLPQIDAHTAMAAAQRWAEATTQTEAQPLHTSETSLTESIAVQPTTLNIGDFVWQPTSQHHTDRPNAVLYQIVGNQDGDMMPSREWAFAKETASQYLFQLSKSNGLQQHTNAPWGPPTSELTLVSQQVQCVACQAQRSTTTCSHRRVSILKDCCPNSLRMAAWQPSND
jgi:hypothetical protein